MAGVRTSVIWMLSNTRLGRQTPRKSRASTSIYGHGSSDWYAAQSVSPRRNRCPIWSSGSSSIGTSLGEQSDTGSTDLKHLLSETNTIGYYTVRKSVVEFPALLTMISAPALIRVFTFMVCPCSGCGTPRSPPVSHSHGGTVTYRYAD